MVVSPEYEGLDDLIDERQRKAVETYCDEAARKSELERTALQKEKTGVFTGSHAVNPVNEEQIPIWVADYVLATYGTGAIMAVPAHDQRDYEFALKFELPIREVVSGGDVNVEAWIGDGLLVNSSSRLVSLDGHDVESAKSKITDWLDQQGKGTRKINYKLRDWLFSRQRYWGEPFPILHMDGEHKALPESDLPVELPEVDSYKPTGTGQSPLAAIDTWVNTIDPETGQAAVRETNTMPQWAGSCWYYLRFIDPQYESGPVRPELERYWMPVDLYIGGAEHAVLHLLYARFWHKVLFDLGVVSTSEPFQRLYNQGMILGEVEYTVFRDAEGNPVSADEAEGRAKNGENLSTEKVPEDKVKKHGDGFVLSADHNIALSARAFKMSKSRGNVINPDIVVERYGADALRLYEMFMGPLDQVKPWSMRGVAGVSRFLGRVWRFFAADEGLNARITDAEPTADQLTELHLTIQKVTDDIEDLRFNTALSALMEFLNLAQKWPTCPKAIAETYVLLLSPFAPHIAEELWSRLGHAESLAYEPWPTVEQDLIVRQKTEVAVQVNGKMRGTVSVDADAQEDVVIDAARALDNVARHLEGKTLRRAIYVPGRIVNFVVS
jgi:leucyl-tRNA synthetase